MRPEATIPPSPKVVENNFEAVPEIMQEQEQWIVWAYFYEERNARWVKCPCRLKLGARALEKASYEKHLQPFNVAKNNLINWSQLKTKTCSGAVGIGFSLPNKDDIKRVYYEGMEGYLTCLDFDSESKYLENNVVGRIRADLKGSFVEISTRGEGKHIWVLSEKLLGDEYKTSNDKDIEVYQTGRFIAVTGNKSDGDIQLVNGELINWMNEFGLKGEKKRDSNKEAISQYDYTEQNRKEIFNLLENIDADCNYEMYRNLIFAIRNLSEFHGWPEELTKGLAEEWSKTATDRYGEKHFHDIWDAKVLPEGGGITYKTIFHHAKESFKKPENPFKSEMMDMVVEKVDKTEQPVEQESGLQLLLDGFKPYTNNGIKILNTENIENVKSGKAKMLDFTPRTDAKILMEKCLHDNGYKKETFASTLDKFYKEATYINQIEFFPNVEGVNVLNLFPDKWKTIYKGKTKNKYDCPTILNFLEEVICDSNTDNYQYLLSWLASAIQNPAEKNGTILILNGGQGTGKGTFLRIVKDLIGHTVLFADPKKTLGDTNSSLLSSYIIIFDDVNFKYLPDLAEKLKNNSTNEEIQIKQLYVPHFTIRSCHNFIIATNSESVTRTDYDDRRFVHYPVSSKYKGTSHKDYWHKLHKDIGREIEEFMGFLQNRKLSKFRALDDKPNTDELAKQKWRSRKGLEKMIGDFVDQAELPEGVGTDVKDWPKEGTFIATKDLLEYAKQNKVNTIYDDVGGRETNKWIQRLLPSAKIKVRKNQKRGVALPKLTEARADIKKYYDLPETWEWDDAEEENH